MYEDPAAAIIVAVVYLIAFASVLIEAAARPSSRSLSILCTRTTLCRCYRTHASGGRQLTRCFAIGHDGDAQILQRERKEEKEYVCVCKGVYVSLRAPCVSPQFANQAWMWLKVLFLTECTVKYSRASRTLFSRSNRHSSTWGQRARQRSPTSDKETAVKSVT